MILTCLKSTGQLFCKVAAIWVCGTFPPVYIHVWQDPLPLFPPEVTLCPSQGGSRNCPVGDGIFGDLVKVILAVVIVIKLLFFSL